MRKLFLLLLFPVALHAQYLRMDFSLQNAQGPAVPNATVTVYNQSACGGTLGSLATIYTSSAGGTPITGSVVTTDGFGHAYAYMAAACYTIVYFSSNTGTLTFPDQAPSGIGNGAFCALTGCTLSGPLTIGKETWLYGGTQPAGTLQAAITAVGAGGSVIVPGNYSETITSSISIANNNVKVWCQPGASIVSSGAGNIFNVSGNSVWITGCTLSGNTNQAIFVQGQNPFIYRNTISGGGGSNPVSGIGAGIQLEAVSDAWVVENTLTADGTSCGNNAADIVANYVNNASNTYRVHIIGNKISSSFAGAYSIGLFNVSDLDVSGNIIDQNDCIGSSNTSSGYGIMDYNTTTASNPATRNMIQRNNIANTAGSAIYEQGVLYTTTVGNVLTNCAQQQLDTILTVGCIAVNAGNSASPLALGDVITGNTLHTSAKSGIETSHAPGVVVSANAMDGIAKYGVWIAGNSNDHPVVTGNQCSTSGNYCYYIQATPGAVVTGNYATGFAASGVFVDTSSPDCTVTANQITGNSADSGYPLFVEGNNCNVTGNHVYGLTLHSSLYAARIEGTAVQFRSNVLDNTGITGEFYTTTGASLDVEGNTFTHTSGASYGITEGVGASGNVYRHNIVTGGTSPGWNLAGTSPLQDENSFNGTYSAKVVASLAIGSNTVVPATMTGVQGTGTTFFTTSGSFTNGHLVSSTSGTAVDSGLPFNTLITQVNACGSTTTCSGSVPTAPHMAFGTVALSTGTATVGSMPAFTSTTTYGCTCSDISAINACRVQNTSTTSITLTGTGSDTISYLCVGN